jgi:hypothetical protein
MVLSPTLPGVSRLRGSFAGTAGQVRLSPLVYFNRPDPPRGASLSGRRGHRKGGVGEFHPLSMVEITLNLMPYWMYLLLSIHGGDDRKLLEINIQVKNNQGQEDDSPCRFIPRVDLHPVIRLDRNQGEDAVQQVHGKPGTAGNGK